MADQLAGYAGTLEVGHSRFKKPHDEVEVKISHMKGLQCTQ